MCCSTVIVRDDATPLPSDWWTFTRLQFWYKMRGMLIHCHFGYCNMLSFLYLPSLIIAFLPTVLASACICSSGFVPISVDVLVPRDPSTETLNTTDLLRLQKTFDVFGELCQPLASSKHDDDIQILLHGQTYTHAYWDISWNGYQNYSYVQFSCQNGITSFSYDNICAGLSSKPQSEECQLPSVAAVASTIGQEAKNGRLAQVLTGQTKEFSKVVGFGHSIGSAVMNYAAIRDGASSPYDALVLTGYIHDLGYITAHTQNVSTVASQADPGRFGNLDPGYITTVGETRLIYYGPTNNSFSPEVFQLDVLTFDVGSTFVVDQIPFTYFPAVGFRGPVAEMVGQFDMLHCIPDGGPCVQSVIQKPEPAFFPNSKNVTTIVIPGTGHSLNAEFTASLSFRIMNSLFAEFVESS